MTAQKIVWQAHENGDYSLSGALDRDTVPDLWQNRQNWMPLQETVRIDLAELARIDSAGMVMLLHLIQQLQQAGSTVSLCHVPQQLMTLLRLSHVESMFTACME
ncbi:TPA: STAS domain-containing protein [Photobacterium damselae]